jgi:hypothetical protein
MTRESLFLFLPRREHRGFADYVSLTEPLSEALSFVPIPVHTKADVPDVPTLTYGQSRIHCGSLCDAFKVHTALLPMLVTTGFVCLPPEDQESFDAELFQHNVSLMNPPLIISICLITYESLPVSHGITPSRAHNILLNSTYNNNNPQNIVGTPAYAPSPVPRLTVPLASLL